MKLIEIDDCLCCMFCSAVFNKEPKTPCCNVTKLVDRAFGMQVPFYFINSNSNCERFNISKDQKEIILNACPSSHTFKLVWEDILENAYYIDEDGQKWVLYYDEDLTMIPEG